MLRVLRIVGIGVFAVLLGLSANSLWDMHETGTLFERYNSARKASATMAVFSASALFALGCIELLSMRRLAQKKGYGGRRYNESRNQVSQSVDATNIYSMPHTRDAWQSRRHRSSRSARPGLRRKQTIEMPEIWLVLLRICATPLPFVYSALAASVWLRETANPGETRILLIGCICLAVLGLVMVVGIFRRQVLGLSLGYLLAICNLLVFPIGTALGLFMLMGLVGATPLFVGTDHERDRSPRAPATAL